MFGSLIDLVGQTAVVFSGGVVTAVLVPKVYKVGQAVVAWSDATLAKVEADAKVANTVATVVKSA